MRSLRDIFRHLPIGGVERHVLRQFNLAPGRNGKAVSVKALANELGLDVFQVELPSSMAGRLVTDPFSDAGYAIEVNKSHSVESRRFSVLHELGHYLLHADMADPLADPMHLERGQEAFYFDQSKEREANDFADTLLFGDGALEAAATLFDYNTSKLSRYFGVTEPMILVALKKFGVRRGRSDG